jgi:CRISPR/Cas system-associated exonuclease Cas4 (RecB family)
MGEIALLLVVAAALAFLWRHLRRRLPPDERWRPRALLDARLVHAERTFRPNQLRIVARLDRAYERDGVIALVEFKTRAVARPHPSDVIELSAQRIALEDETGATVSDVGYVVTQEVATQRRRAHEVRLLRRDEVAALVSRRQDVTAGKAVPAPAMSARMCSKCAYLQRCSSTYGDRRASN